MSHRPEAPAFDAATAYHEAGHAALALIVGRGVHRVTIEPKQDRLGRCEFRVGAVRPSADFIEEEILIALGGLAAEARHTGDYAWDEAGRDLQYVRRLAVQRAGEARAERLVQRLLRKVEHLLGDAGHWRAVEAIAAELMKSGAVSGRAVRHHFDAATR